MAQCEEGQDLGGAGVAPPCRLHLYPSPDIHVVRARVIRQVAPAQPECEHVVFDVDRPSPVDNPFAGCGQQHESVLHAYDDWLVLIIWLGVTGQVHRGRAVAALVARRHGVGLRAVHSVGDGQSAWDWLWRAARGRGAVVLRAPQEDAAHARCGRASHIGSVAGAISWLRHMLLRGGGVMAGIALKAGDWLVSDIYTRWPASIAAELSRFSWPITSEGELHSFLGCPNASPCAIVAFEFTAAVRQAYEYHWGFRRVALSVDVRSSLHPGPHARMDARVVMGAKRWVDAFLHPPCTHQVLSDAAAFRDKHVDGRTFWGIALFIYCFCIDASRVVVEQPATVIPDFYMYPTQRLRPCDVGDEDNKQMHFYERGGRLPMPKRPDIVGTSGHKRLRDFEDAEGRDRWRSSWARFPMLAAAIVAAVDEEVPHAGALDYSEEIERFAVSWYDAGLPVPADYAAPDAMPVSERDRGYQLQRGRGDGRRVHGVLPVSRREKTDSVLRLTDGPLRLRSHTYIVHALRSEKGMTPFTRLR